MGLDNSPSSASRRAPMVVRTKRKPAALPQSMHVNRGYPHYHHKTGSCLCLDSCCYSKEFGCVCRTCSGVGHSACIDINVQRAKARATRERMLAKQRASANGDK